MEFEKNAPTTERDITLANAPRVTLQPDATFARDLPPMRTHITGEMAMNINSEHESTATAATAHQEASRHSHRIALAAGIATMGIFIALIAAFYILR